MIHRMLLRGLAPLLATAALLASCGRMDVGTAHTAENDYTLTLQVTDRFVQVGDESLLRVKLTRTDNSNLDTGLNTAITLYTSSHGALEFGSFPVQVSDDVTPEISGHVRFTARRSGVAEVRATFLDATATVEILVSQGDL